MRLSEKMASFFDPEFEVGGQTAAEGQDPMNCPRASAGRHIADITGFRRKLIRLKPNFAGLPAPG